MAKTVRYVNVSSGVNVRNAAAGSVVRAVDCGTLMIHDSANAPVNKALNGTTYTWIKVTYYYSNTDDFAPINEATGWVAQENTSVVSTTIPGKSSVLSGNQVYRQDERLINARYICDYFRSLSTAKRWSANAICAALGNMEAESGINPGRWQNGVATTSNGFGLVLWTPSTKLTNWISASDDKSDIDVQLERIQHEVDGGYAQWNSNMHTPVLTFKEFTQSTDTVEELAEYFLRCYEQPSNVDAKVTERQACAVKWYTLLDALGDI